MSYKDDLKLISLIGFGALSGATFTLGIGNRDWKELAISSSLGCIVISRLFNKALNTTKILELVY